MTIVHVGALPLQVRPDQKRQIYLEELKGQIEACVLYVVKQCIEAALEAEVTAQLGRAHHQRRDTVTPKQVKARCQRCGSHNRQDFRRNGHYPRDLNTCWGQVRLQMPQVECVCDGAVKIPFQSLRPRQRVWEDVSGLIRKQFGQGLSLREIKTDLDERLGTSVGLRTLNQRVRVIAHLVPEEQELSEAPPVVRLDGIWTTLMEPTGELRKDALGRLRRVKTGRKRPILMAQGVWPAQERQEIIAWAVALAEDEASWARFLLQLHRIGLSPENGLCLLIGDGASGLEAARQRLFWDVPFQRCVFHKLRNIWRKLEVPQEMPARETRLHKRQLIRMASEVWQAVDEEEAYWRQRYLCQSWQHAQPKAVATLQRDFDLTVSFYQVQKKASQQGETWPAHQLRTTSPLERECRTFRKRLRSAVVFHSNLGLKAAFNQTVIRSLNKRKQEPGENWYSSIEQQLFAQNLIS